MDIPAWIWLTVEFVLLGFTALFGRKYHAPFVPLAIWSVTGLLMLCIRQALTT